MSSNLSFNKGLWASPEATQHLVITYVTEQTGGNELGLRVNFTGGAPTARVVWGDGTSDDYPFTGANITMTHTFAAGTFSVKIFVSYVSLLLKFKDNISAAANGVSLAFKPNVTALGEAVLFDGNFTSLPTLPTSVTLIDFSTQPATSADVSYLVNINELYMANCQLSTAVVSQVLVDVNSFGTSNGFIDLSGQTPAAPLNAAGLAAKTALEARGWSVTTD